MTENTTTMSELKKNAPPPARTNGQKSVESSVGDLLKTQFKAIQSALPKHMTPERMCRVAFNTIRRTPELLKCAPESLVAAIVEASSLGLEIDLRGHAYLVPFWNKKTNRFEAQLIPGYKGLSDLAYRSGRVANIFAEVVCENDRFNFSLGLYPKLEHEPDLEERGKLRAVYAVARVKDADPQFVVLGKSEIEKIKNKSAAGASGPWRDWEEEMWKKTAIRRLCKMLPLSPEIQRAVAIDERAEAGISQHLGDDFLELPEPAIEVAQIEAGPESAALPSTPPANGNGNGQTSEATAKPAPSAPDISRPTLEAVEKELKRLGAPGQLPPDLASEFSTGDPSELTEPQGQKALAFLKAMKG